MIPDTATPTFSEAILSAIRAKIAGVNTAIAAHVTAYDADTMRCSAQPLAMRARIGEDGERVASPLPVCNGVPVMFPGGGGRRFKFPLVPGDLVLLVFSQASIDRGFDRVHDPEDDRTHTLSDALAYPFSLSEAATLIEVTDLEINLGGDATEYVALKSTLDAFMTILGAVVDPSGACAALHGALQAASWPAVYVAEKVKAV